MTRRTRFAVALLSLRLAPFVAHAAPAADGTCADANGGAGAGSIGGTIAAIGVAIADATARLPAPAPVMADDYASHWAPVWYQDTDSSRPWADYITGVDFDGDWQGDNNWDNLAKGRGDRSAKIY